MNGRLYSLGVGILPWKRTLISFQENTLRLSSKQNGETLAHSGAISVALIEDSIRRVFRYFDDSLQSKLYSAIE